MDPIGVRHSYQETKCSKFSQHRKPGPVVSQEACQLFIQDNAKLIKLEALSKKTPTWRIIPVRKWLITMVSKSPK